MRCSCDGRWSYIGGVVESSYTGWDTSSSAATDTNSDTGMGTSENTNGSMGEYRSVGVKADVDAGVGISAVVIVSMNAGGNASVIAHFSGGVSPGLECQITDY